jgi:hypothetical protein
MAGALGKSWATAAPLLAEGGTKIAEMVAQGSKLAGVTTEMAQQADELNDKWVLLTGTNGLLNAQVGAALPLLNKLADSLPRSQEIQRRQRRRIQPAHRDAARARGTGR